MNTVMQESGEIYMTGKGKPPKDQQISPYAGSGTQQKMLRTVTPVERYRSHHSI